MTSFVRSDATKYEYYLLYAASLLGGLALFGGLVLTLTGAAFTSNPAANPTGKMGVGLLVVSGLYLLAGLVLARTRSVVAWSVLMATFVVHTVVGAVFVSLASLVPGLLGLYVGYRAARDADYGIPFLSAAGTRSDS